MVEYPIWAWDFVHIEQQSTAGRGVALHSRRTNAYNHVQQARAGGPKLANTPRKPVAPRRATRKKTVKKPAKRGFIRRIWSGLWRFIWRTLWWLGIRIGLIGATVLGAAVFWYYVSLPPMEELLDGRARGSVIMTDRSGEIFAWRGEQ